MTQMENRLAKDRLDIGLITDDPEMVSFVSTDVGLGEPELLRINRSVMQHRFDLRGSVVKVNVVDGPVPQERSGYRELLIASSLLASEQATEPRSLMGPDDVAFRLVPPGWEGIDHMAVRLAVPDLAAAQRYFDAALGWDVQGRVVRLGASVVWLDEQADAPTAVADSTRGWTYLTVQIRDCDAETTRAEAGGAHVARAPRTYGEVARFSMVADPWGNRVELSQRASLTGPLPQ